MADINNLSTLSSFNTTDTLLTSVGNRLYQTELNKIPAYFYIIQYINTTSNRYGYVKIPLYDNNVTKIENQLYFNALQWWRDIISFASKNELLTVGTNLRFQGSMLRGTFPPYIPISDNIFPITQIPVQANDIIFLHKFGNWETVRYGIRGNIVTDYLIFSKDLPVAWNGIWGADGRMLPYRMGAIREEFNETTNEIVTNGKTINNYNYGAYLTSSLIYYNTQVTSRMTFYVIEQGEHINFTSAPTYLYSIFIYDDNKQNFGIGGAKRGAIVKNGKSGFKTKTLAVPAQYLTATEFYSLVNNPEVIRDAE